ncbi:MAG: hypothetical protein GXO79_05925 [Chlorobi bacterium]|nr:hypothetical protein [Chlorobiota bacterium]
MNKKKNYTFLILFVSIFISFSFWGCSTSKERNIIGIWEVVPLTTTNYTEKWSFYDGNRLYISRDTTITDSADYTITSNVLEYFVEIKGLCPDPDSLPYENFHYSNCDDGKYRIDVLKTDMLKLQRVSNGDGSTGATFKYIEFIRSQ